MGNAQTIIAYGHTSDTCITSLQSQLEYEWEAKLFVEEELEKKRYYIYYNNEKRYVEFFRRTSDGPCKAVITL